MQIASILEAKIDQTPEKYHPKMNFFFDDFWKGTGAGFEVGPAECAAQGEDPRRG